VLYNVEPPLILLEGGILLDLHLLLLRPTDTEEAVMWGRRLGIADIKWFTGFY
jgi:hypothetical protein